MQMVDRLLRAIRLQTCSRARRAASTVGRHWVFRPVRLARSDRRNRTQAHPQTQTPKLIQRARALRSAIDGGGGGGGGGSDATVTEEITGRTLPLRPERRDRSRNRNRSRLGQGRRRRGIGSGSLRSSSGGGKLLRGERHDRTPTRGGVLRVPRGITQRSDCRCCCRAPWRLCSASRALSFAASA
jgi:hypothetical protein